MIGVGGFGEKLNFNQCPGMIIQLRKFGTTLTSRQQRKEAWAAFQPTRVTIAPSEKIEVDFEGVITFAPS